MLPGSAGRQTPDVSDTTKAIAAFLGGASLVRDEGQTLAEYALILTVVAVAVVMALILFGDKIGTMWSSIDDTIQKLFPEEGT